MINLARPYLPKLQATQRYLMILDPFAGTGTTLLELLKLGLKARIHANDINSFNKIAIRDNLMFFSAPEDRLRDLKQHVSEIVGLLDTPNADALFQQVLVPRPSSHSPFEASLRAAIQMYTEEVKQYTDSLNPAPKDTPFRFEHVKGLNSHCFSPKLKAEFEKESVDLVQRIVFYLVWRAMLRNTFSLIDERKRLAVAKQVLKDEFGQFDYELGILIRDCMGLPLAEPREDGCVLRAGRYSQACIVNPRTISGALDSFVQAKGDISWSEWDANYLMVRLKNDRQKVDLIITDPPYGINTLETDGGVQRIAELYSRFMRASVQILNDGGQIIMCVPENTQNGQLIPTYMTRGVVVRQMLINAQAAGLEIINPAMDCPAPPDLFRPPFYWESERTLRRAVLHFIFRKC
jgi:hypothetical protein